MREVRERGGEGGREVREGEKGRKGGRNKGREEETKLWFFFLCYRVYL